MTKLVKSPCRNICKLDDARQYCLHCLRTTDEIRYWSRMTDEERLLVYKRINEFKNKGNGMRYISLDIETTGLDPKRNQILEIAMIVEDTLTKLPYEKLPKLNLVIKNDVYVFTSLYPLVLNQTLLTTLHDNVAKEGQRICHIKEAKEIIKSFLMNYGFNPKSPIKEATPITLAGKNVGTFDLPFLKEYDLVSDFVFRHRIIDPSILYVDWIKDEQLPGSQELFDRAKLDHTLSHNALDDAWQVIRVLRNHY